MPSPRHPWSLLVPAALAAALLAACGTSSRPAGTASPAARAGPARFTAPLRVDNRMFPLTPGTQYVYQGKIVAGGEPKPHSVVFTVTDVTKTVGRVRTVVAWDRDFLDGRLQEQELALFAQDDRGNLWNFGEYPEEWESGKLTGAPDTWIKGAGGAYGGIHMPASPAAGSRYVEGRVPAIEFYDVSKVIRTGQVTCVPVQCFRRVLVVDEWSPGQSGHQIKYYAPGVGLVRVGARGGDTREYLSLTAVRQLAPAGMARVRAAVLAMDRRGYRLSQIYRVTQPAVPSHG
jgi:hypothetical protein